MGSWVIYAIIALVAFGVANFLVKVASAKVPVALLGFVYVASTFAILAGVFLFKKPAFSFPGNTLYIMILAGIFMSIGLFFALASLSLGLGSKAVTVYNMNTLVTVALLILIAGEKLTPKVGLGIVFAVVSLYLLTS